MNLLDVRKEKQDREGYQPVLGKRKYCLAFLLFVSQTVQLRASQVAKKLSITKEDASSRLAFLAQEGFLSVQRGWYCLNGKPDH
ncbi:MAG: hypothetical protein AAB358_00135 [Patescibacteria group bacterium]